ncbi:MAG TPA: hypothetical protein VHN15_13475 [Thermoanaerobaculia bacterium]|nr:hypothetical protein [Thermoanaerobaculia bacterium]
MTVIHVNGRITEGGELEVDLPTGLPAGEARITIEIGTESGWAPEEIEAAMRTTPKTGREIVEAGLLGGWKDEGIADGESWVEEQRRRRREKREW